MSPPAKRENWMGGQVDDHLEHLDRSGVDVEAHPRFSPKSTLPLALFINALTDEESHYLKSDYKMRCPRETYIGFESYLRFQCFLTMTTRIDIGERLKLGVEHLTYLVERWKICYLDSAFDDAPMLQRWYQPSHNGGWSNSFSVKQWYWKPNRFHELLTSSTWSDPLVIFCHVLGVRDPHEVYGADPPNSGLRMSTAIGADPRHDPHPRQDQYLHRQQDPYYSRNLHHSQPSRYDQHHRQGTNPRQVHFEDPEAEHIRYGIHGLMSNDRGRDRAGNGAPPFRPTGIKGHHGHDKHHTESKPAARPLRERGSKHDQSKPKTAPHLRNGTQLPGVSAKSSTPSRTRSDLKPNDPTKKEKSHDLLKPTGQLPLPKKGERRHLTQPARGGRAAADPPSSRRVVLKAGEDSTVGWNIADIDRRRHMTQPARGGRAAGDPANSQRVVLKAGGDSTIGWNLAGDTSVKAKHDQRPATKTAGMSGAPSVHHRSATRPCRPPFTSS